jgi:glycosyltransferase involved in cell wall biosynthesis
MKINILTRCTRPKNLMIINDSICDSEWDLVWHIIFDINKVTNIPTDVISELNNTNKTIVYHYLKSNDFGHDNLNIVIKSLKSDTEFVYVLDDDNVLYPNFLNKTFDILKNTQINGLIFSQQVDYKDIFGVEYRFAKPENIKVGSIDMAQFLLTKKLYNNARFSADYVGDGLLIENIYKQDKSSILLLDEVLCYYNKITKLDVSNTSLPKILVVSGDKPELKTTKVYDYDTDELSVTYIGNKDIIKNIININPDTIITIGGLNEFGELCALPLQFRKKWLNFNSAPENNFGDTAFNCAMHGILTNNNETLISICTPVYNTDSNTLVRLYNSIRNQTYDNWEWCVVNDGDNLLTEKILKEISEQDPRVIVYDFKNKSNGNIGEVKYRAFMLSKGELLVELDHDDYLLPKALESLFKAHKVYPHCGFFYSDCVNLNNNWESLTYGDQFAFGYGKYRKETIFNKEMDVCITPNINPITIRHIVSTPNHFRAWTRQAYINIGGHNRNLPIVDDYELVVRSFLTTYICKVDGCLYLQFFHDGNAQETRRADIQRRVRYIAQHYSEDIKKRIESFGVEDWAYKDGVNTVPRFGVDETPLNYVFNPE